MFPIFIELTYTNGKKITVNANSIEVIKSCEESNGVVSTEIHLNSNNKLVRVLESPKKISDLAMNEMNYIVYEKILEPMYAKGYISRHI